MKLTEHLRGLSTVRSWISAHGPYGGYITGLTIDPQNPSIIYVGGMALGVFKSFDGGASWQPKRDGIVCDWVSQIDVYSGSPDIVAAASFQWWKGNLGDIYGSVDGGENWSSLGLEGIGGWRGVHISRKNWHRALAGGEAGIYLSTDAGQSWSHRDGTETVWEFTYDPSRPDTIYAGGGLGHRYRSTDGGETWNDFAQSIPNEEISSIVVDPSNSNTIYCSALSLLGDGTEGIYKSTNFGSTWTHVLTQDVWDIRVDPTNPDIVWAGGAGPDYLPPPRVWKSTNEGLTWTQHELETDHYYAPGLQALEINPQNGNEVYVGLYNAGVMRTTDGGISWEPRNAGLSGTLMNCIAVHPAEPATIYAGTYQAELWKTTDGGNNWFWSSNGLDDVNNTVQDVVIDPDDPQRLYMGAWNSGLYRTTDGGSYWENVYPTYEQIACVEISPHNSQEIWAGKMGLNAGLLKSTDGGDSWEHIPVGHNINALAISPFDPQLICAGTIAGDYGQIVVILVSRDGGATWEQRFIDGSGGRITSIAFSPTNPFFIYATSWDHNVIKSINEGFSWIPDFGGFDPQGRVMTIVADPIRANTVYLAVDDDKGFYASFNGGMTWFPYSEGMWVRSLIPLIVNPLGNYRIFYTGISGDGIYYNFIRMP
jgi:photosystem II stability/assembly factor-like uncharacterized protein